MIDRYYGISPKGDLLLLKKLGEKLSGKRFLHINSTRSGGGVAEILQRMMPMLQSVGINARWEVIEGDEPFFDTTKKMHNALQGHAEEITAEMWQHHYDINKMNAEKLDLSADAVLVHDPQPAPLIDFRKDGRWFWRCHIDLSKPAPGVFEALRKYCEKYEATVFSVSQFARSLPIREFIIAPSIDPLAEKNVDLPDDEIRRIMDTLKIPVDRPILLQVSRFDRFKDPIGVIKAYRIVKRYNDCILVLAGSPALDDPEGTAVLSEVTAFAADDPDIHILLLPPFSDKEINALQRTATVIFQKSTKEGFGLTVSESMWKSKPVIGGAVGGIPLQIAHGVSGFLVHSIEGAAFRARQLLNNPAMAARMGTNAKEYIRRNFLITRQTRDYLALWYSMENPGRDYLEL